ILRALGCAGLVTNGAVRDLHEVRAIPFPMFAGNVSVSHAYAHVSGFGETVEVGGLEIRPDDLLLADLHGVVSIPLEIAARVPRVARQIGQRRRCLVDLCRRKDFLPEMLNEACRNLGIMKQEGDETSNHGSKGDRS
ncbi:MAG TPA: RraA family protein, partial [Candidatus Acidoferrales bacterium]|nr:RraA family protein [Candidatus Acidoferrales bacterium]